MKCTPHNDLSKLSLSCATRFYKRCVRVGTVKKLLSDDNKNLNKYHPEKHPEKKSFKALSIPN
jgi:hypothetical protein